MTEQEIEAFPAIKVFIEALARQCKDCFMKHSSKCNTCPCSCAVNLMHDMEVPCDSIYDEAKSRKAIIIATLEDKHPAPCYAKDFVLPGCSSSLRALCLYKMSVNGEIERDFSGSYPKYFLKGSK